jgi:hypothetical protein
MNYETMSEEVELQKLQEYQAQLRKEAKEEPGSPLDDNREYMMNIFTMLLIVKPRN